jgi:iron complex outermembrane receptor protein
MYQSSFNISRFLQRRHEGGRRRSGVGLMGAVSVLALATAAAPSVAAAQDEVDPIVVLGTRRSDLTALTSATPVDVVSADKLKSSGADNISAALQKLVPSFHFVQDNPSTSVQYAVKGASLHGLGPDQVLVLVNGVRYHLNSQLNTGYLGYGRGAQMVDIDTIPAAAIENVEILRDGASAQYGSDAIAGVINIKLKTNSSGGNAAIQAGSYSTGGGTRVSASGTAGFSLPHDGSLTISAEAALSGELDVGSVDTRQYYFTGDSREATVNRHWFYGSGKYNKYGILANAELPINDTLTAFGFATATSRQNYGFANFRRPIDDGNVRSVYPNGFQPMQKVTSTDYDVATGLRHESDVVGTTTFTVEHGRSEAAIYTWNTINASLGASSPTAGSSGSTISDSTNVSLDNTKDFAVSWLASPLTVGAGLAYRHEGYEIVAGDSMTWINGGGLIADGTNAGKQAALGSQGASGFQPADAGTSGRDVAGGYVDLEAKLTDKLDIGLAGRSEHYSDFGWTSNGKISGRYAFTPKIAIRGTASTGYRAPSIGQVNYSRTSGIFVSNVQYLQRILPADSAAAKALGAEPLRPEKSKNYSAGVVLQPAHGMVITVDAYQVKVDDRIVLTGTLSGTYVSSVLAAAGFPQLQGAQFFTNALDTKTQGIDVLVRKTFRFENSSLDLSAAFNTTSTHITRIAANPSQLSGANITLIDRQQKGFITKGQPNSKLVLSAAYSRDGWTVTPTVKRYGRYLFLDATVPARDQSFSSQWIADLNIQLPKYKNMQFSLGANNILDSHPDKQIVAARNPIVSEYSSLSPEGAYGTYYYMRMGLTF